MINSLNNLISKYIAGVGKVALLKSKNNKIKLCILYHGVGITRMHEHKHVLQKANTVEADPDKCIHISTASGECLHYETTSVCT